ncbi:MAG: YncE family protein, partial [Gemmatimonadales bacterium]|jgi:YVTN family beta-propeller protein
VSELDVAAGRLRRTFDVPPRPEAIAVTADGSEVWVGSNEDGTVSVIDTRTGDVETVASGFGWPYRILITPDNRLALIPDLRGHELRVLDRATRRELHRFPFPGGGPQGITVAPDGTTVYHSMSQQGRVAVIDLDRMEVTGSIETSPAPDGVAVGR